MKKLLFPLAALVIVVLLVLLRDSAGPRPAAIGVAVGDAAGVRSSEISRSDAWPASNVPMDAAGEAESTRSAVADAPAEARSESRSLGGIWIEVV